MCRSPRDCVSQMSRCANGISIPSSAKRSLQCSWCSVGLVTVRPSSSRPLSTARMLEIQAVRAEAQEDPRPAAGSTVKPCGWLLRDLLQDRRRSFRVSVAIRHAHR